MSFTSLILFEETSSYLPEVLIPVKFAFILVFNST